MRTLRAATTLETFTLDVAFDVAPGEIVALVGPNGAGKSATFGALLGHHGGTGLPPPVGWVPQRGGLLPRRPARDQITPFVSGRSPLRRSVDDALRAVGSDPDDRRPGERLSGGEAQRVAVVRALLAADLVLLDEPTAAQDDAGASGVRRLVREHATAGGSVVLASHSAEDAHALADRLVVIEHGRVTQTGTATALAAAPATGYVARRVGATVLHGTVTGGVLTGPWGDLTVPDDAPDGTAVAIVRPAAVTVHRAPPATASTRNVRPATVAALADHDMAVLVRLEGSPSLVASLTHAAVRDLDLQVGDEVWAGVKANEVTVLPAANATGPVG